MDLVNFLLGDLQLTKGSSGHTPLIKRGSVVFSIYIALVFFKCDILRIVSLKNCLYSLLY